MADNAILSANFTPSLPESLAPEHSQSLNVIWVHAGEPNTAGDLGGSLGITLDGRIARRNLHYLSVDIIRIAPDEAGLAGQCAL